MELGVALLIMIAFGVVAYLGYYAKQKRIREIKVMATQLGLEYWGVDVEGILMSGFALFSKGDGRGIENVMRGTWNGLELREFDYWYYEESTNSKGGRSKTYYRFSAAVAWIDAACPGLTITRENILTRAAGVAGFDDIQFELEEFNRDFHVRGPDRKFAYEFLDARMIAFLMGAGDTFNYEVSGRALLVYCRQLAPASLIPLLGTLKSFHDQVPRVVYELRGQGGETKPGEIT